MATLMLYTLFILGITFVIAGLLYGRYKKALLFKNSVRLIYLQRQLNLGLKMDEQAFIEMESLLPNPLDMTLSLKPLDATVWLSKDQITYLFN